MKLQTHRRFRPYLHRDAPSDGCRRGFSLIELLIVIAVVVILGLILLTVFTKTWKLVNSWRSDGGTVPTTNLAQLS